MGIDNIKFAKPGRAKWRAVRRTDDTFTVYQPDGAIYGRYASLSVAARVVGARQREEDDRARKTVRPCLCCQRAFQSEGIHNRLCDTCRRGGGEYNPHAVAPRNGRPR